MTSLLPSSTGGRHGAQRSDSTNLNVINLNIIDMSESIDLILLIVVGFVILIFHARADYLISNGYDSSEELNKAIVRDIVIIILYLFIKYIIINL